jgi:hypothetical protein
MGRTMKHSDLVKKWGNEAKAAAAIGESRQNLNRWKKRIPLDIQVQVEVLTGGELKADLPLEIRGQAA